MEEPQENVIYLRRKSNLMLAARDFKIEIDGKEYDFEGPIERNSTITGEDFSLTLESAFGDQQLCCSERDL